MTVASMMSDLQVFALLLLAGFVLREICPPLQKLFLPAAVIGGTLALVLGPQVLGWIEIPSAFSSVSGTLIDVVMTCLMIGLVINFQKIKQFGVYTLIYFAILALQALAGMFVGDLLSRVWTGLPTGWGLMGIYSFYGGHGAATTVGNIWKEMGVEGNLDIGLLLATIGIITAMVVGMIIVNYGVRKGWTTYVTKPEQQPTYFYHGTLPEDQKKPIGYMTVSGNGINAIALNACVILLALFIGQVLIRDNLARIWPGVTKASSMLWGVIGGAVLWPILVKLKLDKYVDLKTVGQINGFCLELIILTAMATIKLSLLAQYIVPILIYCVVVLGLTYLLLFALSKRFFKAQWFENLVMLWGRCNGVAANGLALVRTIDPDNQCDVGAADGVATTIYTPLVVLQTVWPSLILAGSLGAALGIAGVILAVSVALLFILFKNKG